MAGDPPLFRTADTRWGSGLGRNLLPVEFDENNFGLHTRIADLEDNPPSANSIANVVMVGNRQMQIFLQDGTSYTFNLPIALLRWRGEWAPATAYSELDLVLHGTDGLFLVRQDHTSAATFDPSASNTAGDFYQQIISEFGQSKTTELTGNSYTLASDDGLKYFRCTANDTSGLTTITIPNSNSVAIGIDTEISFRAVGNAVLFSPASGVTLNTPSGYHHQMSIIGATATLKKVGDDEWDIFGLLDSVSA